MITYKLYRLKLCSPMSAVLDVL